ncbi:neuronal acetylcholine receptor subunit alpha-2-like [Branchiostoma floridae]|uniref:Neuronal acetylcholine receptor subunit alpha-2-like n=1 Tax=Branchiostoma floridae TaxID=7739 RepID=A0A9J7HH51_BRAFL|nr:neuronal acetylcholine receptor subunit alpha-2-like [Branchiostoma floridae]
MECHICFSLSAIEQTIECGGGSSCDVWSPPEQSGEWNRKDKIFAESNKKACFAVHLERIPLFHIATTVGPCIILVVLMIITFVMPIGKGDRISFGVTILLSMVVSLVFVTEVLPVKGALPFFATLIVVCMGLMGLFLFFTMYIITLYDIEGSLSPMAKTFFLYYVAKFLLLGDLTEKETASGVGETGLAGLKLDWSEQASLDIPAEGEEATDNVYEDTVKVDVETSTEVSADVMKVDVKTPADVSDTTRDIPVGPPTRLEAAVEEQTPFLRQLIRQAMKTEQQLEELTKAMKNEQKVSDYTLLTKVLDRLCLVLYVISVALTVPMTMYLGK